MVWSKYTAVVIGLAMLPFGAKAAIEYEYVATPATTTLNVNEQASFSLYLRETVSGSDTSFLDADNGLFAASVSVAAKDPSNHAVTIVSFTGNTTDFDTDTAPQYYASTNSVEYTNLARSSIAGVKGTAVGNVREVYLGSVTLKGSAYGATEFIVGPIPEANGFPEGNRLGASTFTLGSTRDLDLGSASNPSFAPASSTSLLVLVPEPGTIGVVLLTAGMALLPRRRGGIRH